MSDLSREERHSTHFPSAVRDALPAKNCWVCADKERLAALEDLLRAIVGPDGFLRDSCRYDHHDYCQEHGLYEKPCPVGEAQAITANTAFRGKDAEGVTE